MKRWMKRITFVLVAILTLGIYTPTYLIADDEHKEFISPKDNGDTATREDSEELTLHLPSSLERQVDPIQVMTEQAKEQTIAKLGPRITEKVEDEFTMFILPKLEEALQTILMEADEDEITYYTITEQPAGGYGEKIFNVFDNNQNQDIARFHVRRDNRPQEGYWFNFHYHLKDDGFEYHHTIGEIYWDKNTPPKWMA